jgi:hypothetical protein
MGGPHAHTGLRREAAEIPSARGHSWYDELETCWLKQRVMVGRLAWPAQSAGA